MKNKENPTCGSFNREEVESFPRGLLGFILEISTEAIIRVSQVLNEL